MVLQHMLRSAAILACIIVAGAAGFMMLENLSFVEAIYLTVTTVSTVGYGDIVAQTSVGRLFTISLIAVGVGLAFYTFTLTVSLVIEGQLKNALGRRGMQRRIANLEQHIIVCGAGKVGSNAISRLQQEQERFVVIDNEPSVYERLVEEKVLALHGDATIDETLIGAGILKARGIIAALAHDSDNVYVTLTARSMNPNIIVVARADRPEAERKLRQAGATIVISPAVTGGRQMANALTKPFIMDVLENVFYNQELHLDIAPITVNPESVLAERSIAASGIKAKFDSIIVAIKRGTELISNPKAEEIIHAGDILILLGRRDDLSEVSQLAGN